jgi:hypothetical protein
MIICFSSFMVSIPMLLTSPKSSTSQNSSYAVILDEILDFYLIRFIWG